MPCTDGHPRFTHIETEGGRYCQAWGGVFVSKGEPQGSHPTIPSHICKVSQPVPLSSTCFTTNSPVFPQLFMPRFWRHSDVPGKFSPARQTIHLVTGARVGYSRVPSVAYWTVPSIPVSRTTLQGAPWRSIESAWHTRLSLIRTYDQRSFTWTFFSLQLDKTVLLFIRTCNI
jgi:hypothetical protein